MSVEPRSPAERRRDTEHRLTHDIDVWVATASADGTPYLVPLSFDWDGEVLLMATPTDSPTGRNLAATRAVRLVGGTRKHIARQSTSRTKPHPTSSRSGRATLSERM